MTCEHMDIHVTCGGNVHTQAQAQARTVHRTPFHPTSSLTCSNCTNMTLRGIICPSNFARVISFNDGNDKIRTEISVHIPIAAIVVDGASPS